MPPGARAVTFHAERAGDGTGFKVMFGWLEGGLDRPEQDGTARSPSAPAARICMAKRVTSERPTSAGDDVSRNGGGIPNGERVGN